MSIPPFQASDDFMGARKNTLYAYSTENFHLQSILSSPLLVYCSAAEAIIDHSI